MDDKYSFFYEQAVNARNFHYDNFSKWQTFFYVAIGAVLVAYCTVTSGGGCCGCANSGDACKKQLLEILLSALGYMFSLIWLCSSRGYTYWWNAYMKKLKKTEKIVAEHFGATDITAYTGLEFTPPEDCHWNPFIGGNFSTSRLANALAFVSAWAWGILLVYTLKSQIECNGISVSHGFCSWCLICLSPLLLSFFCMRILGVFFHSSVEDQKIKKSERERYCGFGRLFSHSATLIIISILASIISLIWRSPDSIEAISSACSIFEIVASVYLFSLWILDIVFQSLKKKQKNQKK